jgi:hypothetical protein
LGALVAKSKNTPLRLAHLLLLPLLLTRNGVCKSQRPSLQAVVVVTTAAAAATACSGRGRGRREVALWRQ